MKVTTNPPAEPTYVLEVSQEELERIYWLSYTQEGGDYYPKETVPSGRKRIATILEAAVPGLARRAAESFDRGGWA